MQFTGNGNHAILLKVAKRKFGKSHQVKILLDGFKSLGIKVHRHVLEENLKNNTECRQVTAKSAKNKFNLPTLHSSLSHVSAFSIGLMTAYLTVYSIR